MLLVHLHNRSLLRVSSLGVPRLRAGESAMLLALVSHEVGSAAELLAIVPYLNPIQVSV